MKKITIIIFTLFFLITLSACANIINDVPRTTVTYANDDFDSEENLPANIESVENIRDLADMGKARVITTPQTTVDETKVTVKTDFGLVNVDANPRRIITLFNEATETAVALGFSPIGYVSSIESDDSEVWHDFMLENGMDPNLPVLGNTEKLDINAIRALQPDLIFASYDIHGKYYNELNNIAPTIFTNNSTSAFNINFLLFSEALGKKEEAESLLIDYYLFARELDSKYNKYMQQYATVLQIEGDKVYTLLGTTFSVEVLKEAGLLFFASIEDTDERIETNIKTVGGDVFFVSVSNENGKEGNQKLHEFIDLENESNDESIVYEVPYGIWDSTNGYICAREILREIHSVLATETITNNKYDLKRLK